MQKVVLPHTKKVINLRNSLLTEPHRTNVSNVSLGLFETKLSFLNSMLTFSLVGTEYCRNSFHLKLRGQSAHERSNKVCKVCLARNSALSRWLGRAIYASIVCTFLHRADISRAVPSFFHVPRRPFSTLHAMFCAQHAVRYAASETTVVAHCSDGWIGGASYLYKLKDW